MHCTTDVFARQQVRSVLQENLLKEEHLKREAECASNVILAYGNVI
jgi:hypothetical protein